MTDLEVRHVWKEKIWDWPLQRDDGVARVYKSYKGFEVNLELQVKINHTLMHTHV